MIRYEHHRPVKVRKSATENWNERHQRYDTFDIWSISIPVPIAQRLRLRRNTWRHAYTYRGELCFSPVEKPYSKEVKVRGARNTRYPRDVEESYSTYHYSLGIPPALAKELGLERGMLMRPMIKRGGVLVYVKEVAK